MTTDIVIQVAIAIFLALGETIILHWLCMNFLQINEKRKPFYWFGFMSYAIFHLLMCLRETTLTELCIPYFFITYLFCIIYFKDKMRIKLLISYLFVVLNYSCKLMSAVIMKNIFEEYLPLRPVLLVQSPRAHVVSCILFFIVTLIFILCRRIRRLNKQTLYSIIFASVPSLILVFSIQIFYAVGKPSNFYVDVSCLLFCAAMLLFYMIDDYAVIDEEIQKNKIAERLLMMQTSYYHQLEEAQQAVASLRHDLNKHLHALLVFLKEGENKAAQDYIENIYQMAEGIKLPVTGGNPMINILVNHAEQQAKMENICFNATIMVPEQLPFSNVDICVVLGNLLDNAVEAASRPGISEENRFIQAEIRYQKAFLLISISNSYNGKLIMKNGHYESTKQNSDYSGIGLSNVDTVLKNYEGSMKISHTEKVFTVTVLLPMEPQLHN